MATLGDIELLTKDFSDSYGKLTDKVRDLEEELETVKRRHMRYIKDFSEEALKKKAKLSSAIEDSPELFIKPKSIILHGFKVGMQRGKGKVTIPDEEKSIDLIRKVFGKDEAEKYIKVEEKLIRQSIETLSAVELKKVGINITESTDSVIIKPINSDIDKIVTALLKEEPKDLELLKNEVA